MSPYYKFIIIIFGLAYLLSPMDIIPELLIPYVGWIDDGFVIGTIIYLIRHGKLPDFNFKGKFFSDRNQSRQNKETFDFKNRQTSFNETSKSPYDILGVNPGASKEEIQQAYKKAIKKYHPDKVSHLGDEFADLAKVKFVQIQKAYDELMTQN